MAKIDETVTFKRQTLRNVGWVAGGVIVLGATFVAGSAIAHVMGEPRGGDSALGNHGDHSAPGQMDENTHPGDGYGDGEVNDGPDDQNHGDDGDGESNDDAGEGAPGMTAPSAPPAPQGKPTNP